MALTDGLVAYYKLDGDATDVSGNGNDGTIHGATVTTGKINQCYNFDGSNDYIDTGITDVIVYENDWSFAAWVYTEDISGYYGFANKNYQDDPTIRFQAKDNGDGTIHIDIFLGTYNGGNGPFIHLTYDTIKDWHYIVTTFDSSTHIARLYVDGNFITSGEVKANITNSRPLQLGITKQSNYSYSGYYFDGKIDEVGIWNRALTEEEVTQLYNNGDGLSYPFTTSVEKKSDVLFFGGGF